MTERNFQTRVIQLAKFHGWSLVYHTHDSRNSPAGFPDLVMVHPAAGRLLWRELKTSKGRIRPEQKTWLAGLVAAGQDAGVWRPTDLDNGVILTALDTKQNH